MAVMTTTTVRKVSVFGLPFRVKELAARADPSGRMNPLVLAIISA